MVRTGRVLKWFAVFVALMAVGLSAAARTGAWVDEVVFGKEASSAAAILQLGNNDLDVFAFAIADASLFAQVRANPVLAYSLSGGSYNEFTFNPAGPVFSGTGKLNPFAVPRVREAINYLIDRDYLANEICGGMATPRYTYLSGNWVDGNERLASVVAAIAEQYAPNPALADQMITEEMGKLGASKVGGVWQYQGAPVEIILLIRTEDERRKMGDYLGTLLEGIGFKTVLNYRTSAEASPIWNAGDPNAGLWHVYTGGWVTTAVPRDEAGNDAFFYTNLGSSSPLWQAYVNTPEFYAVCEKMWNSDFKTMDERKALMTESLWMAMKDSVRVWLVDRGGFSPSRANVQISADKAGGVYGSQMWALTANFQVNGVPQEGGSLRVKMPAMLNEPWNPIAGTNFIYDMMPIRGTGDPGYGRDTTTGLIYPNRFERAEVTIVEGLPVGVSNDWVKLAFVPEIKVPADAWYDWDATAQRWITVGEKFPEGLTALRKSVVYYPSSLYDVKLHDGSTISIADFVLFMILGFDRAKPESAIYDASAVPAYNSFMSVHKGYRIVSRNPLVIEAYSDLYNIDAELCVTTFFPYYAQGPGFWHVLTLGIMAEESKLLAFSKSKANTLGVEWMSFISGPTLSILEGKIYQALSSGYRPYEPTMAEYLPLGEAVNRWTLLENWYRRMGHFWVASGPLYLDKAYPIEKAIVLKRFADYPDSSTKWMFLLDK
jgi:peptide/nickel transport system substrate-binding protein